MSWDTAKDYMNAFIAILIILIPLIKEARKEGKKSTIYIIFLSASCVGLFFLGKDKIDRDRVKDLNYNRDRISYSNKMDSLVGDVKDVKRKEDSIISQIDSSLKTYKLQLKGGKVVPINITFENNQSTNVSSNDQKGGQTAAKIVNH